MLLKPADKYFIKQRCLKYKIKWKHISDSDSSDSDGCFPSTAKVNLENGNLVSMSELQCGDRVQAGIKSDTIFRKNSQTV